MMTLTTCGTTTFSILRHLLGYHRKILAVAAVCVEQLPVLRMKISSASHLRLALIHFDGDSAQDHYVPFLWHSHADLGVA